MTAYVYRNGRLVEKHLAGSRHTPSSAPSVIRDEMDATRHMGTGKFFTSKAKFRAETKAIGAVEVGNDTSLTKPRKPVVMDRGQRRDAIRQAIYQLRNR